MCECLTLLHTETCERYTHCTHSEMGYAWICSSWRFYVLTETHTYSTLIHTHFVCAHMYACILSIQEM